jgi:hypothetical protein
MSQRLVQVTHGDRLRLARATRALAQAERTEFHRGGVLELGTVAARVDLLDRVVRLLEDMEREVTPEGTASLARLVSEIPPVRDYGPAARRRNDRIAAIIAELGGER